MDDFPQGISSFGVPAIGSLPIIPGTWYFVNPNTTYNSSSNPYQGSSSNDGKSIFTPLDNLSSAYGKCISGRGDGICLLSNGTAAANTTSYLSTAITWSKHGITVVGAAAPTYMYGRARVANSTSVNTLANLITVSGNNNSFINVHLGNFGSDAAALGCLDVTGARNYFYNCHFIGAGHTTPAQTTGSYSVQLTGAQETTFERCVIGTDTVDQDGSQANTGILKLGGGTARALFRDCHFLSYWSYANSTCAIVHWIGAGDAITRHVIFDNCLFMNYKTGLLATNDPQSVFVGTAPNNGACLLHRCGILGFGAIDATGANDRVYVTMPATNLTGGVAVVTS